MFRRVLGLRARPKLLLAIAAAFVIGVMAVPAPAVAATHHLVATAAAPAMIHLQAAFVLPGWFTGLAPAISYLLNAVIFKAIEQGTGEQLPTPTKRLIVGSVALLLALGLVATGNSPLPVPLPAPGADVLGWFAFISEGTVYVFAGGTAIFALIEAVKAIGGSTAPSLPTKATG